MIANSPSTSLFKPDGNSTFLWFFGKTFQISNSRFNPNGISGIQSVGEIVFFAFLSSLISISYFKKLVNFNINILTNACENF